MRLLINTLSIGSMSGEHVVYGFLGSMLRNLDGKDHAIILHYENQPPPEEFAAPNVTAVGVPDRWRFLRRYLIGATGVEKRNYQYAQDGHER